MERSLQNEEKAKHTAAGYDKVFEMDVEGKDNSGYTQKAKYESKWCKHNKPREDAKGSLAATVTTAQTLGWREHYDTMTAGHNRSGMCKRTFYDPGHL